MKLAKYPEHYHDVCDAALNANREIAPILIFSMSCSHAGYERISKIWNIPYDKADFYGWQRKAYYNFYELLTKKGVNV